ncbi:MAG: hypothetical protein ACLP19_20895 [Xanthobacteraceae bacterium]
MPSLTIWTRLEPRCRDADLTTALQARTHDPLWFLARQWQLGEMLGDDAGSPVLAAVTTTESVLNRVAAGSNAATTLSPGTPLEAFIEREAVRPSTSDIEYRQSADAGLYFLRLLRVGNVGQLAPLYVTQYGIAAPTAAHQASLDAPALAVAAIVANRVPDGARLAADLRAAQPGLPATPVIPSADRAAVQTAANAYLEWYDSLYDAPATGPSPSWVDARMEYEFSVDASATDTPCAFVADRYTGEPLDWLSFDHSATPLGAISTPPAAVTHTLIPAPVTFKGMPAPRYWQLEDASVDIGAVDAGPADTARLMLREFALIYGNDWFVVPIPVTVGAVAHVTSLFVTDTFGITQTIPHYSATPDGGRWRIFAISGDAIDYRLILPPVLARGLDSQPQEQVLLVRDDAASMAWGVEKIVAGASGTPIDRASAAAIATPTPPPPTPVTGLRYELGTSAPAYYIPFVANAASDGQRRMQRAALLAVDGSRAPITPLGRILASDTPVFEEEFIREGVRIDRLYRLARWTDGSTHLWLARRKTTGAVAGSSGLQFDQITTK